MDYARVYSQFIADRKAKESALDGYTETHHIVPRSRGGTDDAENLIELSMEDHIHAHILLAKIYGGSLWAAVFFMTKTGVGRKSARRTPTKKEILLSAFARRMHAQNCVGEATAMYGKRHTEQTRSKMSAAQSRRGRLGLHWTQNPENAALISGENHWTKDKDLLSKWMPLILENARKGADSIKGESNPMHRVEVKEKIRASHANHAAAGTGLYSKDARAKNAASHRTDAFKAGASARVSGSKNPMHGKTKSDNPNARSFLCVETGEIFNSAKDAKNFCGVEINRACSKGLTAGGYHWKRLGTPSPLAKSING